MRKSISDSTHATIYKLIDPRTLEVRYVGATTNPFRRKSEHQNRKFADYYPNKYTAWRLELRGLQLNPQFVVIQECSIKLAAQLEEFWIAHYLKMGCDLVNTDGVNSKNGYKSPASFR